MTKRPYFRLGVGLVVVGAALVAVNIWFLATGHWVPSLKRGNGFLIVIGGTMLVTGVMVLLGY
jgi:predicted phage tail protein